MYSLAIRGLIKLIQTGGPKALEALAKFARLSGTTVTPANAGRVITDYVRNNPGAAGMLVASVAAPFGVDVVVDLLKKIPEDTQDLELIARKVSNRFPDSYKYLGDRKKDSVGGVPASELLTQQSEMIEMMKLIREASVIVGGTRSLETLLYVIHNVEPEHLEIYKKLKKDF
jgi:hypothetical protein